MEEFKNKSEVVKALQELGVEFPVYKSGTREGQPRESFKTLVERYWKAKSELGNKEVKPFKPEVKEETENAKSEKVEAKKSDVKKYIPKKTRKFNPMTFRKY